MKLLTKELRDKLLKNGAERPSDPMPVVKLFHPAGAGTWLLTEMDDDEVCFGLCDPGHGTPELGSVYLPELAEFRGRFGLGIERDLHFKPNKTLSQYADEANTLGRIKA